MKVCCANYTRLFTSVLLLTLGATLTGWWSGTGAKGSKTGLFPGASFIPVLVFGIQLTYGYTSELCRARRSARGRSCA